jgi:hypothetical protein
VALGLSNAGTSLMLTANLEYTFGERLIGESTRLAPHVRVGLGILSVPRLGTEGVLNLSYGASSRIGTTDMHWFAEHQGIDLFNRNRLVAGVRWGP